MTSAPEPGSTPARAHGALPEHDMTERLRALAEPTRLRLLTALRAIPQQRACVTDLTRATGIAQPTVSRHLQVLHRAALLTRTRDGSRAYYQVDTEALQSVAETLTPTRRMLDDAVADHDGVGQRH